MKHISDSDYFRVLRLLYALSKINGQSVRERENARKAGLLHKKLVKRIDNGAKCNT